MIKLREVCDGLRKLNMQVADAKSERNELIAELRLSGIGASAIAAVADLNEGRIRQILREMY